MLSCDPRVAVVLLDHLEEECSELIQASKKLKRFGPGNRHPDTLISNMDQLYQEAADVLVLMDMLKFDQQKLEEHKRIKIEKLKQYRGEIFDVTV